MSDWDRFFDDLNEQLPLIMSGLENTLLLATSISITGFLFGILGVLSDAESEQSCQTRHARLHFIFYWHATDRLVVPYVLRHADNRC